MTAKMTIMLRAVKIRMEHGEDMEAVLASYPKLTAEEADQIRQEVIGDADLY